MSKKLTIVGLGLLLATGQLLLLCISAAAQGANAAKNNPDVLFYCSFDNTLQPEIQSGPGDYHTSLPGIVFIKGHKGQAFVTGDLRNVTYPLQGNINVNEGSIKFWVMPIDWSGGQELEHNFVMVPDSGTQPKGARVFNCILYRFPDWPIVLAYGMANELTADHTLRVPMDATWVPQQWHQIVFTWNHDGAALYVDGGQQTMRYQGDAPTILDSPNFIVGGPYFIKNGSLTAIDELYIYRRALTKDEVTQMYQAESKG